MASPTILIVDDDRFVRTLLRDCLEGLEARLLEASDGGEALEQTRREQPAVVLLDLVMPGKSGLEILPELIRVSAGSRILVISSVETRSLVAEALQLGASGYLAKPFHPEEIADAVREALGS